MRAILIERDGTRHKMEIDGADTADVVLRNGTRKNPSMRVFCYVRDSAIVAMPTYEEVDFVHIDAVPSER